MNASYLYLSSFREGGRMEGGREEGRRGREGGRRRGGGEREGRRERGRKEGGILSFPHLSCAIMRGRLELMKDSANISSRKMFLFISSIVTPSFWMYSHSSCVCVCVCVKQGKSKIGGNVSHATERENKDADSPTVPTKTAMKAARCTVWYTHPITSG